MNQEPNVSELCRMIRDTVGSALHNAANSPEVHEIKQTVREMVDELTGQLRSDMNYHIPPPPPKGYHPDPPNRDSADFGRPQAAQAATGSVATAQRQLRRLRTKGNVMTFFGVLGATLGGTALVGCVGMLLAGMFANLLAVGLYATGMAAAVGVAFSLLARRGLTLYGMAERFPKYQEIIGSDRFCAIRVLAESMGRRTGFVVKDLQRMIRQGMLPQAKLDATKSCLILDDETYQQYLLAEQRMKQSRKDARKQPEPQQQPKAEEKAAPEAQKSEETELNRSLQEGKAYIERMREANRRIPGEQMSRKIDRLEQVSRKIFEHVEQHPEKLPDIRRFMSYYLPITLKLLESYCRFDEQEVQGENLTAAKAEIDETLDTIILAFENLLDSLFQMEVFDLSTDISALEAMLAQEGLTGSDFKKKG
ncbi:MAG: 5-bromo-4-chloroindolyl phosphate hydrolysis family protein [Angelakisella sp.]